VSGSATVNDARYWRTPRVRYKGAMNTKPSAVIALAILSGVTGCDRLKAALGKSGDAGDDSGAESAAALSFAGFEGEIDVSAKGKSSPTPTALNMLVKSEKVRVDVPTDTANADQLKGLTGGGKAYGVLNTPEKKLYFVMDAKKQAVVIDLNQAGEHLKTFKPPTTSSPQKPNGPPPEPPKVTKTGKKDKVAGYTCEEWDVENQDKTKLELCVADQGASFFHLPLTGIPTEHAWALELLDGKHFPLRGVAYEKDGTESGRVEVTKIDKRSLDAAEFEVPAGYKVIDLQQMLLQGFGGAGFGGAGVPPGAAHRPGKK
jgi:hypothetical protein